MTSLQFWLALMTPFVSHPLYMRRGVWQPPSPPSEATRWGKWVVFYNTNEVRIIWVGFALLVAGVIFIGFSNIMVAIVIISIGVIGLGFPTLFALSGTIYGIVSALTISGAIINERLQGRYLILGVTPSGFLGAAWALCSISVQNSRLLRQLRTLLGTIYGVAVLMLLLPFLLTTLIYFGNSEVSQIYDLWSILIIAFSIIILFLVDFFQSACIGGLLGLIAPHYSETRANTQNSVISNFLALQFGVYLVTGFICLFLIPSIFSLIRYPITPFYGYICAVVLYAVREVLIIALWHGLAITIDDDVVQLNRLTRIRIKDRSWAGHLARRLLRALWRNPMD
ncbi:MAG: hypothetical protein MUE54_09750 [Anaerolineae bacterium]|nr:hypothetical protein [Anaerolineae bacterium]